MSLISSDQKERVKRIDGCPVLGHGEGRPVAFCELQA